MKTIQEHIKKQGKRFPIKITMGNVYFCFCLCVIIYALLTPFLTIVLKHYGNRCKAVITSTGTSWLHRYSRNDYQYEFNVENKYYTGNSLIEVGNEDKIGDTIDVLYFRYFPTFNRPVYFYKDE